MKLRLLSVLLILFNFSLSHSKTFEVSFEKPGETFHEREQQLARLGAFFTDYPVGSELDYVLEVGVSKIPVVGGYGLKFAGANRSDDLDTNFVVTIVPWSTDINGQTMGLKPNTEYKVKLNAQIASNLTLGAGGGTGGSPKAVVLSFAAGPKPPALIPKLGNVYSVDPTGWNITDIGNLGVDGSEHEEQSIPYSLITRTGVAIGKTNALGQLVVWIFTHSGIESYSEFYYKKVTLVIEEI